MNNKIFIEYDNSILKDISDKIYNLFLSNNYNVELLDNNISLNEKISIIENSNTKSLILSNKINNNDANSLEIIYPLRSTDELARVIYNKVNSSIPISKYYQLRASNNTSLDYYELLRNIGSNSAIIIRYGTNTLTNTNLPNLIYQSIISYITSENIYIVKSGDSLYSIARNFNTTVDEIKKLNNLTSNNLSLNQKLIIPATNINNNDTSSQDEPSSNNVYTVKSGDSLYSIARTFNTTVDEIKKLNNLTSNNLSINQKLIIPSTNQPSSNNIYTVKSGDSLYSIARKFNTTIDEIKKLNNLTSNNLSLNQKLIIPATNINNNPTPEEPSSNNVYTVKSSDSLYSIARKFNTTVDEIKKLNNLTSNNLSINQKLIIPSTNQLSSNNIYTVKSGDSLYSIARKFNTTIDEIKKLNNLTSNNLSINQKLIVS